MSNQYKPQNLTKDNFSENGGTDMNAERHDTMEKQHRLLVTKTVRLKREELNVRYAELGDPANPAVLLLHGVPENLQAWYAVARSWPRSTTCWRSIGLVLAGATR